MASCGHSERYQENKKYFMCERQRIRKKGKDVKEEEVKKLKFKAVKEKVEIEMNE